MKDESALPATVDRATFQAELDGLRVRENAHTREGDAIAAARRRLPIVEVDAYLEPIGPDGPLTLLDAFEGRRQLIACSFMWKPGRPAPEQCEGCTWVTTQVAELSYLHSPTSPTRSSASVPTTKASAPATSWAGRCRGTRHRPPRRALRRAPDRPFPPGLLPADGDRVFETYWTNRRGVEVFDYNYALTDLTAYGRQEPWEDSPPGWPQGWQVDGSNARTNNRPIDQWSRIEAGRSDDLSGG